MLAKKGEPGAHRQQKNLETIETHSPEVEHFFSVLSSAVEKMDDPTIDIAEAVALEQEVINALNNSRESNSTETFKNTLEKELTGISIGTFFDYITYFEQLANREASTIIHSPEYYSEENISQSYLTGNIGYIGTMMIHMSSMREEHFAKIFANHSINNIRKKKLFPINTKRIEHQQPGEKIIRIDARTDAEYSKRLLTTDPPLEKAQCWKKVSLGIFGVYNKSGRLERIAEIGDEEHSSSMALMQKLENLAQDITDESLSEQLFASKLETIIKTGSAIDLSFWSFLVDDSRIQLPPVSEKPPHLQTEEDAALSADMEQAAIERDKKYYDAIMAIRTLMQSAQLDMPHSSNLEPGEISRIAFFRTGWPQRYDDWLAEGKYGIVYANIQMLVADPEIDLISMPDSDATKELITSTREIIDTTQDAIQKMYDTIPEFDQRAFKHAAELNARIQQIAGGLYQQKEIIADRVGDFMKKYGPPVRHVESIPFSESLFDSKWNPQHRDNLHPEFEKMAQYMQRTDIRTLIERTYDLHLDKMSLGAQLQLASLIINGNKDAQEHLQHILRSFGNKNPYALLETLHALSQVPEKKDEIFEILTKHDDPFISEALNHYELIVESATTLEQYIAAKMPAVQIEDAHLVVKGLITRANRMLFSTADRVQKGETALLVKELDQLSTEVVTIAAVCEQTVKKNPTMEITLLENLALVEKNANSLDDDTLSTMIDAVEVNFQDQPNMVKAFIELLTSPEHQKRRENIQFHFLTHAVDGKQKILSFLRVETLDDETVLVGSYNVNPHAQNAGIAESLGNIVLKMLHPTKNIRATFLPTRRVGTMYIDRMNFVADSYVTQEPETYSSLGEFGMLLYKQSTQETFNAQSRLRGLSQEDIKFQYAEQLAHPNPAELTGEDTIVVQFNTHTQIENIQKLSKRLLNESGYVMTRYFCADTVADPQCDVRIFGFEKKQPHSGSTKEQD